MSGDETIDPRAAGLRCEVLGNHAEVWFARELTAGGRRIRTAGPSKGWHSRLFCSSKRSDALAAGTASSNLVRSASESCMAVSGNTDFPVAEAQRPLRRGCRSTTPGHLPCVLRPAGCPRSLDSRKHWPGVLHRAGRHPGNCARWQARRHHKMAGAGGEFCLWRAGP